MRLSLIVLSLLWLLGPLSPSAAWAAKPYKVLVVFSYEETFPWDVEIREGIERVLGAEADLHYFYMDTKLHLEQGEQKAAEAYALYRQMNPDGVIAVDDNAQSMFVLPYLKDQVETPVIVCGVNAEPEDYGYPATNVTGVLERQHLEETIAFSRLFTPKIETFAFMIKPGPTARILGRSLEKETPILSARPEALLTPASFAEALQMARQAREQVDLLFVGPLQGIVDAQGRPMLQEDVVPQVVDAFGKATAGLNEFVVQAGVLSAVVSSPDEQGSKAARMLLQVLHGTPIANLPMTRNYRGRRLLNATTLRKLGLVPNALHLRGVDLIRSE